MPIYELTLRGPLHVGEAVGIDREATLEWMPSDSLFGAFVAAWVESGADINARLAGFLAGETPFRITSAFPRDGALRLLPAPAALRVPGLDGKQAKRVRWLSSSVFESLRKGEPADVSADSFVHDGAVWLTPEERLARSGASLWQAQIVPRVTVDRMQSASNLFHTGRVNFGPEGGLWFAARGPETGWIDEALHVLADAGLGGLRNYGHGAFVWRKVPDDLPLSPSSGPGLCLSRYAPAGESEIRSTLQNDAAAYRLVTVGGWCTDDRGVGWRRRAVRLLTEGALLPDAATARGGLVEVQPKLPAFAERKVYRYAVPFFIEAGRLALAPEVSE